MDSHVPPGEALIGTTYIGEGWQRWRLATGPTKERAAARRRMTLGLTLSDCIRRVLFLFCDPPHPLRAATIRAVRQWLQ